MEHLEHLQSLNIPIKMAYKYIICLHASEVLLYLCYYRNKPSDESPVHKNMQNTAYLSKFPRI